MGQIRPWFFALAALTPFQVQAASRPVVLELFTSQGCSSCPAADALLKKLAAEEPVLALSYHVHYWDRLGWKDPFSSEVNTDRQRVYASHADGSVYTPEMIIDGKAAAIGSQEDAIHDAINEAAVYMPVLPVAINASGGKLEVTLPASGEGDLPPRATVWAMQFRPFAKTQVTAGENNGKTIDNIDNVVKITRLGTWNKAQAHFTLPTDKLDGDRMAVLVQTEEQGRMIGVGLWPK